MRVGCEYEADIPTKPDSITRTPFLFCSKRDSQDANGTKVLVCALKG